MTRLPLIRVIMTKLSGVEKQYTKHVISNTLLCPTPSVKYISDIYISSVILLEVMYIRDTLSRLLEDRQKFRLLLTSLDNETKMSHLIFDRTASSCVSPGFSSILRLK